jgi:hypothetical protein
MTSRKHLKQVTLLALHKSPERLLMDVNNQGELQDSFAWAKSTVT